MNGLNLKMGLFKIYGQATYLKIKMGLTIFSEISLHPIFKNSKEALT